MKQFIIVANGPFLNEEIIREAIQEKEIIALDGAADKLLLLGVIPHVILGDFDSVHPQTLSYWGIRKTFATLSEEDLPYQGQHGVWIVPAKNQEKTDLTKAIEYCDQQHAQTITLICATGGREDQHEATKWALQTEYKQARPLILHSEQQTLRWAENETITFQGEIGDPCGFVAQNESWGNSTGLQYRCQHTPISLCNRLIAETASLQIVGSALLMLPPLLKSQRNLLQKNEQTLLQQLKRV